MIKEWLYLTFFPEEDTNQLNRLRANLTPFLKAVTKALSVELESGHLDVETKNSIIDEIIRSITAEESTSSTVYPYSSIQETPNLGYNGLLDLR